MKLKRELLTRMVIAGLILMSGLALIPFLDLPQTTLGWEQFAGIYTPELVIEPEIGRPGSTFTGTGSNYPPNSLATLYVDGEPLGLILIDGNGSAIFYINTNGSSEGVYNVTLEVDINASATDTFQLLSDGPFIPAPTNPSGTIFSLNNILYLPIIVKN